MRMGEMRTAYRSLVGKPKRRDYFGDQGVGRRIIIY
jgi:hypothetical protein